MDALFNSSSEDECTEDNKNNAEESRTKSKFNTDNIFLFIYFLLISILFIEYIIILYFTFCGIAFLTINLFIYNWLSLLTKKSVFVFLSILSNFSDLGLFFILSLSTFSTTSFFGWLIDFFTNYVLVKFKKFLEKKKKNQNDCDHIIDDILPFLFIYFLLSGLIILFFFVIYKWLFYVSIAYEINYLLYAISPLYRLILKYTKNFKIRYNLSNDENTTNEENANSDHLNDINNSNINDKCSIIDNNECITATNKCSSINDEANDINSEYSLEYIEEINNNSYSDTNINDENNDNDYSNVINLDDVINNIEAFITTENNIVNAIDINDIIINFNSNINKVNEKIETINSFSSAWRFLYHDTNETIHNLNINKPHKKKIHKIKYPGFYFNFIKGKLNDDVDNLTQIKKLNDSLCELNNKYFVKFVSNIKKNILTIKNIKSMLNDQNSIDDIEGINEYINNFNEQDIKKNKKINLFITYTLSKIRKTIRKQINVKNFENEEVIEEDSISLIEYFMLNFGSIIPECQGMFDNTIEPREFLNNKTKYLVYKIIICVLISGLQLYSILYPFIQGFFSIGEFFAFLIVKICLIERICAYNIIDICINWKKVKLSLKKKLHKYVFYAVLILSIIIFIAAVVVIIIISISKSTIFPTIDNALYIENNQAWNKYKNISVEPDGFCFIKAQSDGTLQTEDFAMLGTLPRLYGISKDNKCYIKPSMRGLFNSTMKYIFGQDYEKNGIRIMCKKTQHNIYLVISSDKILNQTLRSFSDTNITLLNNQFNIINTNYFENFSSNTLSEKGKLLYDIYLNCKSQNTSYNCDNEWDMFTQYYWPNYYSENYVKIPGFERYQINIDSNMIIQPSFITKDGEFWAGTHYIIGGGYDDSWSFGFFIETIGRKYIPLILENLLPFYSLIRSVASHIFIKIEWINKHIFYIDDFATNELNSISKLYKQFNFSHHSIFLIGHSISGTVFKVISLATDLKGITFEASDSTTNMDYLHKSNLKKIGKSKSQIANIYSDGTIITGNDDNCDVNGKLPKRYILPSIYDTACLTAISCSSTMKYIPFCRQVLSQNKKDPIEEFNISYNAYLEYYGFK